jgi:hypothetical protein
MGWNAPPALSEASSRELNPPLVALNHFPKHA